MTQPDLPMENAPRRVLLSCPQRIGDVLLATPLARAIKRAWPNAAVDMLVFAGTEGALEGNADIANIIIVPRTAGAVERFRELKKLWRNYDLALSPIATDRARLYCWAAGRRRFGMILPLAKDRAKALLLNQTVNFDDLDTHTVSMGLALTQRLVIAPSYEVVPPCIALERRESLLQRLHPFHGNAYAVLHVYPKFRYKMWTKAGWIALAESLRARGFSVLFTGGPDDAERAYVNEIARAQPDGTLNLAGTLSLAEAAELIRGAAVYVGPDTAVTHIAAATGTPTVALFGPSNPVKWGPWPSTWNSAASPWPRAGSARQGNVFLVQGAGNCVPCMLEGCERHVESRSDCLDTLALGTVIAAVDALLSSSATQKTIMLKPVPITPTLMPTTTRHGTD